MNLTKEDLIKVIEETINYNKAARQAEVDQLYKDANRRSNDVLAKARHYIKGTDEYERGLEDAWRLARLLTYTLEESPTAGQIRDIYGCDWQSVFRDYTVTDALSAYNNWLKEKEAEAAKPKFGDVVEVISNNDGFVEKGIFLSECFNTIKYLNGYGIVEAWTDVFKVIKTGEHVDIQGMLDKINE